MERGLWPTWTEWGFRCCRTFVWTLRALGFTLAAALATGIIFALAPALQASSASMNSALNDTARGSTAGRSRQLALRRAGGGGVLLRLRAPGRRGSADPELSAGPGRKPWDSSPARALAVRVDPDSRIAARDQPAYFSEVLRRAMSVPGVETAGLSDALPLGRNRSWGAPEKGHTYPKGQSPDAFVRIVSENYVAAMGIPLREGRDFDERDGAETDRVMLINETMARRMFPGQSALGKEIRTCGPGYGRIVGVVGDVRHLALEQGAGMEMYIPIRQCRDFVSVGPGGAGPGGCRQRSYRRSARP